MKKDHSKEFSDVIYEEATKKKNDNSKENTEKTLFSMTPERLKSACVTLVTENGRPFSLMDDSGFREIIDPYLEGFRKEDKICISRKSITELTKMSARDIRNTIIAEIKDVSF